jgi:arabinofuranosyltransferase
VVLVALCWARRWSAEDSFINYRVVDQVRHWRGPVYNRGQRVEVFTSPLWLAYLVVAKSLAPFLAVEWIGVLSGLLFTAAGVVSATVASVRLSATQTSRRLVLPAGMLVLIGLQPFWDFATSGLETGLSFAWSGTSVLLLTRLEPAGGNRRARVAAAVCIGAGPLVRPDFALISVSLFAAFAYLARPRPTRLAAYLAVGLLPAIGYELFRMAYFAALVPNTALAKAAGGSDWNRGARYLWDLVGPHALWAPVLLLVAWSALRGRSANMGSRGSAIRAAAIVGASAHALYVVRIGGDYMHGRLLLPAVFLVLSVGMVVEAPAGLWAFRRAGMVALGVAGVGWVVLAAGWLRAPYQGTYDPGRGLSDERGFWSHLSGETNPVTLADYSRTPNWGWGQALATDQAHGVAKVFHIPPGSVAVVPLLPLPRGAPPTLIGGELGITGFRAGIDVRIVDVRGLGDPVAARLKLGARGTTAGHEKHLSEDWALALASPPSAGDGPNVVAARAALRCGDLADLERRISARLSPGLLLSNVVSAPAMTMFEVPDQPTAARARFCS